MSEEKTEKVERKTSGKCGGSFRREFRERLADVVALRTGLRLPWFFVSLTMGLESGVLAGRPVSMWRSEYMLARKAGLAPRSDPKTSRMWMERFGGMLSPGLREDAAVEAEPKPLPAMPDEVKEEPKDEPAVQKSPVVARHQMSAMAAGMQTSFAPLPKPEGFGKAEVKAKLRKLIAEKSEKGERVLKAELMRDAGFPEWLAEKVVSAPWKLSFILPKMLWHTPPAQAESLAFLREQPECTDFVPLLDEGIKTYDAAVAELEERRAGRKA